LADWAGVAIEHADLMEQARAAREAQPPAAPEAAHDSVERAATLLEALLNGHAVGGPAAKREMQAVLSELRQLRAEPAPRFPEEDTHNLVDIPKLIRQVAAELRPIAARRGLELISDVGLGLPLVPGDRGRILQIVGGLTAAAIRRTHQGRIVIDAHTFTVRNGRSDVISPPGYIELTDGPWLSVTVADTSSGLSPDTIRALTADRVEAAAGELGPGLTMGEVRLVTESLGGALWHDQTPAGTLITVSLPAG
jgi:signal transduction histidine kinase